MKKKFIFTMINCALLGSISFAIHAHPVVITAKPEIKKGKSCIKLPAKATSLLKIDLNLGQNHSPPVHDAFDPRDSASYSTVQEIDIYDSLGKQNLVQIYFVKISANRWIAYVYIDMRINTSTEIAFDTSGKLTSEPLIKNIAFNPWNGAATPQIFNIDISCITQADGYGTIKQAWQDGYGPDWSFQHTLKPIPKKSCAAQGNTRATNEVKLNINLNAYRYPRSPYDGNQLKIDPKDSSTYDYSVNVKIYDSLGAPYPLTIYFVKSDSSCWTVNAYLYQSLLGEGLLEFDTSGQLIKKFGLEKMIWQTYSGAIPQPFNIDMTCSTQYGGPNTLHEDVWQDGIGNE